MQIKNPILTRDLYHKELIDLTVGQHQETDGDRDFATMFMEKTHNAKEEKSSNR